MSTRTLYLAICIFCSLMAMPTARATESDIAAQGFAQKALQAELAGDLAAREQLLAKAIQNDPDNGPARWQMGQIRVGDAWLSAKDAARMQRDDARWEAYLKRRDALIETAEQHRELARWCRKNALADVAKLHWTKALEFEPDDAESLAGLGLKWHDGQLKTRAQIDEARKAAGVRLQTMRTWRPQVLKWRAALDSGDVEKIEAVRGELAKVNDPAVLAVLESVLASNRSGNNFDLANLALIEVAARMPQPEATQVLLRRAIDTDSAPVRVAACEALRQRPLHAFVPQLIAAMPETVQTRFRVHLLPNGTVVHEHEMEVKGPNGTQIFSYESTVHPADLAAALRATPAALANESSKAAAIEANAAARESQNRQLRERLKYVLHATTGFENADDQELWAKQYAEYCGLTAPEPSVLVQRSHVSDFAAFYSIPPRSREDRETGPDDSDRLLSPPPAPQVSRPITPSANSGGLLGASINFLGECFAAGTSVMTISGPRAIETITAGDRVLAQDPTTGELAYRVVQERTLRRGMRIVNLRVGTETIPATFGHPFWVVGKGWSIAGRLQPGDRIRTLDSHATVESVEAGSPQEVYNLRVSDFATFFVGAQQLLVHDDSQVSEVGLPLPGFVPEVRTDE